MAESESAYALASVARVVQYMGSDASRLDTEEVLKTIRAVGSAMEDYCGRRFRSREYVHDGTTLPRLDSTGGRCLWLPNAPVTAVSSLKTYPNGTALTEWDGTTGDYVVGAKEGVVELLWSEFWNQRRCVEITYTGGFLSSATDAQKLLGYSWEENAEDVRLACVKQTAWVLRGKDRVKDGVVSRSFEGVTTAYLTDTWLPEVKEVLDRHRWEVPVR